MIIEEKFRTLCAASRYDLAAPNFFKGQENTVAKEPGITIVHSRGGKAVPVLKLLFSNSCIYDCLYCPIRKSNDIQRTAFTVHEVVQVTRQLYQQRKIQGLFLSSGILREPDYTSQLLVEVARTLRLNHKFPGYIHLKVIPGTSDEIIRNAGLYADRISVNIELPSPASLARLAPDKDSSAILEPMQKMGTYITQNREERKLSARAPVFSPAGHTTQLIIGATPESDAQILTLSHRLYKDYKLSRVYYSAYVSVNSLPGLPSLPTPPVLREHRLYQADWLIRFYDFHPSEILPFGQDWLDEDIDPKTLWAVRNIHLFPVEINKASAFFLKRIPGIGMQGLKRILHYRQYHLLSVEDVIKLGVSWEKARHFVTIRGKFYGLKISDPQDLLAYFRTRTRIIQAHLPPLPGLSKNSRRTFR